MKNMITKSIGRSVVIFSIIVLVFAFISSPDSEGQFPRGDQENAATAIATICSALIEGCARQPSLCALIPGDPDANMLLVDIYNDSVEDILALDLEPNPDDIALARGIMRAALITAVARQPEARIGLESIEALCREDIDSL